MFYSLTLKHQTSTHISFSFSHFVLQRTGTILGLETSRSETCSVGGANLPWG